MKCVVHGCSIVDVGHEFVDGMCRYCHYTITTGCDHRDGSSYIHFILRKANEIGKLEQTLDNNFSQVRRIVGEMNKPVHPATLAYARRYAKIRDLTAHGIGFGDVMNIGTGGIRLRQGDELDEFLDRNG